MLGALDYGHAGKERRAGVDRIWAVICYGALLIGLPPESQSQDPDIWANTGVHWGCRFSVGRVI